MNDFRERLADRLTCPICGEQVPELVYPIGEELQNKIVAAIQKRKPHWVQRSGACHRCLNYFQNMIRSPSRFRILRERLLRKIAALHHPASGRDHTAAPPRSQRYTTGLS